jgi:hypothetical protein
MSTPGGRRRLRPAAEDHGRLSPDQPVWEVDGEQRGAEEGYAARPQRALVPESVRRASLAVGASAPAETAPDGAGAAHAWRQGRRHRSGPSRRLLAVALALGLFAAGTAVGSMLVADRGRPARPATAALTTAAPPTTAAPRQVTPPACLSAIDQADAAISYLVTNVHDGRLARAMQQYRVARRACRRAG